MDVREYLKKHKLSPNEFSRQCDIPYQSLRAILLGKSVYMRTAIKIEKGTNGEVTVSEIKMRSLMNEVK